MRRPAFAILTVVVAMAALPGPAAADRHRADGLRLVSGSSPFVAGCPGAAFDLSMIAGQELEPAIAVNPQNPWSIVATWIQDVGPQASRTDLIASSHDGGKTWNRNVIPGLTKCEGGSADSAADPWVGARADGEFYFSGLTPRFVGTAPWSAVTTSHSGDGGRVLARACDPCPA